MKEIPMFAADQKPRVLPIPTMNFANEAEPKEAKGPLRVPVMEFSKPKVEMFSTLHSPAARVLPLPLPSMHFEKK